MQFTVDHSRNGSAGATGAPTLPGIDFDAYRRKAARLRAQAFRHVALAVCAALVNAVRAVIRFTHAKRETCDNAVSGRDMQRPSVAYALRLLGANDNSAGARRSESA
jgi:hypothetical protein